MDSVLRAFVLYAILFVLFRVSGRRTLAESSPFDLVLLLIVGEATQQALLGDDFSITNAVLVIMTLLTIDVLLSLIKEKSKRIAKIIDSVPTILVVDGKPLEDRLKKSRVSESDVLDAAREWRGLERMDQIKYAVLETNGGISIIPKESEK